MKFGIFYELQLPRPWAPGDEHRLYQNALDQVELADTGWAHVGTFSDNGTTYEVWTDEAQRAQLLVGPGVSVIGGT